MSLRSVGMSSPDLAGGFADDAAPGRDERDVGAALELLALGLRNRAGSVEQLAAYAAQPVPVVLESLAALEAWGYVSVRGDFITYRDPDHAAADQTRSQLAELGTMVTDRIGQVASVLETLPRLLQLWSTSSPEPRGVIRADAFFGADCLDQLWRSEKSFHRPARVDLILTDTAAVERPAAAPDLFLGEQHTRVLAPAPVQHGQYGEDRVETRLLSPLPTWLLIIRDDVVAMPLTWGEPHLTAVMAVHDASVVTLAEWMFERLWNSAVPASHETPTWDSLMRLLAQGATIDSASRSLGISTRTGRRRLSDAMDYFGVDNPVALGVAWASSRPMSQDLARRP
jgi:hypothetical protein